jgi:hypothetical protein
MDQLALLCLIHILEREKVEILAASQILNSERGKCIDTYYRRRDRGRRRLSYPHSTQPCRYTSYIPDVLQRYDSKWYVHTRVLKGVRVRDPINDVGSTFNSLRTLSNSYINARSFVKQTDDH